MMEAKLPAAGDAVKPSGDGKAGQRVCNAAEERERCVVQFLAKHSPPDQLKSVMEGGFTPVSLEKKSGSLVLLVLLTVLV